MKWFKNLCKFVFITGIFSVLVFFLFDFALNDQVFFHRMSVRVYDLATLDGIYEKYGDKLPIGKLESLAATSPEFVEDGSLPNKSETYQGKEGLHQPLSITEDMSEEELRDVFDYLFAVYMNDSPTLVAGEEKGVKKVRITPESRKYLYRLFNDKEAFRAFLKKGAGGSYLAGVNFPYYLSMRGDGHLYFKGNFVTPEEQRQLDQAVKADIAALRGEGTLYEGQSEKERLHVLYRFLANKADYMDPTELEQGNTLNSQGINMHSPYSVICGGDTVCQGYVTYYMLLARELNIPLTYVEGQYSGNRDVPENHAWVGVETEEGTYYIDPTGGDQKYGVEDRYFYMTRDWMEKNGYIF